MSSYKYFQKSKNFLFPLLGIPTKGTFKPANSYLVDLYRGIDETDYRLVVVYELPENEKEFSAFELKYLIQSKYFEDFYKCEEKLVYIFNMEEFKEDWDRFLEGRYSLLSGKAKRMIDNYHTDFYPNKISRNRKIVDTLFPDENVFERYSRDLGVSVDLIRYVKEVCDTYDKEKETLDLRECFAIFAE